MTKPKAKPKGMEGITKRGDTYYVRVRLNGVPTSLGSYTDPEDAKGARDAARASAHKGQPVLTTEARRVTVGQVAAEYLATETVHLAYNTRARKLSEWRTMEDTFSHVPVAALTPSHVKAWFAANTGAARDTVRLKLELLRAILDRAALDYGVPNVAKMVKLPRQLKAGTEPKGASRFRFSRTPEEVAAVIAKLDARYRVVAMLALGTGLRSGEARGLTLDRVDFSTGAIRVERQLLKVTAGDTPEGVKLLTPCLGLAPLKTVRSWGTVYAGADLLDAITAHVEEYGTGPEGLVASSVAGGPLPDTSWTQAVARAAAAAKVPDFKGHEFRHVRGSWALAAGATLDEVAADLRDSVATVVKTYLHPTKPTDAARSDGVLARLAGVDARKPRAKGHLRAVG